MNKKSSKTKEELLIKIRQLESKSNIWLENSPVCTKILDLYFNLQYMSSSGIREFKIDDITEFYGKPYPLSFYPDSFRIPMIKNLKRAKETGETRTQDAPTQDIEGNTLWYHSTIVPVYNDQRQLDYIMLVSLETTARKQGEEKTTNSLNQLRRWHNALFTNKERTMELKCEMNELLVQLGKPVR